MLDIDDITKQFFIYDNSFNLRQIKVGDNYIKAYRDYINLLKFTIFSFIIIIPVIILTKFRILSKSLAIVIIAIVITIVLCYIIYRLAISRDAIFNRDSKDYDLIKLPDNASDLGKESIFKKTVNLLAGNDSNCDV
tara:strand:- start:5018 stop:5425 length:408 start_codon:yes stop_codon:yes gene_type:complete